MVRRARRGATALLARRAVAGVLVALAVMAGVAQQVLGQPEEYTSTAVVSFAPRADRQLGADTLEVLSAKYVAYISAPATLRRTAAETGTDAGALQDAVSAVIPPATANLSVSATAADPAEAARLANALGAAVVRQSAVDVNLRADLVAPAVEPAFPSGTPPRLLLAAGAVVAVAAGALAVLLLGRLATPSRSGPRGLVAPRPRARERSRRGGPAAGPPGEVAPPRRSVR
ncbi:hypothetical protein D5H78_02785 [Vallicoccus soli]|uniref:Polysaccharide chain length determinant N-terminal domain-containing protein n=1 Tax=Vallicoccus soli TaxID=2339232 RepID=A0A3A3Z0Y3_9ACTN|nr:hypothetical protein D5H78_02785 [Vallicoccus soli]